MEQAHAVKVPVRAEACDPVVVKVAVEVVALQQAPAEIVSVQTAVKQFPTNWEHPALSRSVLNAVLL
ncbi:MAG: hypothetical protein PVI06_17375 [Desulfobacterales bacterium]|jgi:hypothetical protein